MKKKIYYNLTKIKNGWLVSYLVHTAKETSTEEEYKENLEDIFNFILEEEKLNEEDLMPYSTDDDMVEVVKRTNVEFKK